MKISALLLFNLGVELGQIIFICVALVFSYTLLLIQATKSNRARLVQSGIYGTGVLASYWLVST